MIKQEVGKHLIGIISVATLIAVFFIDPIKQDPLYHQFVDDNPLFGIPNFWNVASNLPFFFIGLYGLWQFKHLKIIPEMGVAYWLFFFSVAMVAFGSGYYHWSPSNETLLWDRLPMTIAFMSLFSIVISEFIGQRRGALLLIPFLVLGVASVLYWHWSESNSMGDLRFYGVVQFLPLILIPIILLLYPPRFVNNSGYWMLIAAYAIAKILELFDTQIYNALGEVMSGHAIKHVAAAIGVLLLVSNYKNRVRIFTKHS